jgi:hypothetical protein
MDIRLRLEVAGARKYEKVSYPIRYGTLAEITLPGYRFHFTLNGEIKYLQGIGKNWPHPSEWLKRTVGNHWIYYDSGGYNQIYDYLGEYYLPCFTYPTNQLWEMNPFSQPQVREALAVFRDLPRLLTEALKTGKWTEEEKAFLLRVARWDETALAERAWRLEEIIGGKVNVLPPDSRHVDYDCIPLNLADGCLYRCRFCRVKTNRKFAVRPAEDIQKQLLELKDFFGPELKNYNSLFLGEHDALNAGRKRILEAAFLALETLELSRSHLEGCNLFLFGSVDSLLTAEESLFKELNRSPFRTYLNIGLESAHQETLDLLGKPLSAAKVEEAFRRLNEINRRYERVEGTANFVIDLALPPGHWESLSRLSRDFFPRYFDKGALYLSPLSAKGRRELLRRFQELKRKSRCPLYLYLIQRL